MPQIPKYRRPVSTLQTNLEATNQQRKFPLGLIIGIVVGVLVLAGLAWFLISRFNAIEDKPAEQTQTEPSFDKTQFPLDNPASPWVIVNKQNPLSPTNYTPTDLIAPNMPLKSNSTAEAMQLRAEAATALETLNQAAANAGVQLLLVSGYRSYDTQADVYESMVRGFGQAQADRESARPGHSEHQTGWAADIGTANRECELEICFADTPEGKWLAEHAHTYGFVIRYADGKEAVTGYQYEPWHLRYVGKTLAQEMHDENIQTLEEFFELPNAPSY